VKVESEISIYLDTNVLMDVKQKNRKNDCSEFLINQIKRTKNLTASISTFTMMELVDIYQELLWEQSQMIRGYTTQEIRGFHTRKNLEKSERMKTYDEIRDFVEKLGPSFRMRYLSEEKGWKRALELLSIGDFSAPDAVHLATALEAGCDAIATGDEEFAQHVRTLNDPTLEIASIYCDRQKNHIDFNANLENLIDSITKRRKKLMEEKTTLDIPKVLHEIGKSIAPKDVRTQKIIHYERRFMREREKRQSKSGRKTVGSGRRTTGKYSPLEHFLRRSRMMTVTLSYAQIEKILESRLPPSAHKHKPWWANGGHSQANSWLNAGWKVDSVSLGKSVTFKRV
jgi:predicted nucleic acid-binding protein